MSNFSAAFDFARICPNFGSPWFENISRFYNRGQNSLTKPNTNRTKTTCLLLPPTPSPYAMTTEHRQPKKHSLTVSPFIILTQLLLPPPPSPLCNVDVGSDACQETVCDPKDNIESGGGGGGGGGGFGSVLVHK